MQLWALDLPGPGPRPGAGGWGGPALVAGLEGHTARVTAVRASADGGRVVSVSAAGEAVEWDVAGLCPLRTLVLGPDAEHVAYAALDASLV